MLFKAIWEAIKAVILKFKVSATCNVSVNAKDETAEKKK